MRLRAGSTLAVLCTTLLLSGCGGGSALEDVVDDFVTAWTDRDYEKACDLTTRTAAFQALIAVFGPVGVAKLDPIPKECSDQLRIARSRASTQLEAAKNAEIEDVDKLDEENARVYTNSGNWELQARRRLEDQQHRAC